MSGATATVRVDALVFGGQGIATLPSGKRVFAYNALPGELVRIEIQRRYASYEVGRVVQVLEPSPDRIEPAEPHFLSCSPWQVLRYAAENTWKQRIAHQLLRFGTRLELPELPFVSPAEPFRYRNKMEFGLTGQDGPELLLFERGGRSRIGVTGCLLAHPVVDETVRRVLEALHAEGVPARALASVRVRASSLGQSLVELTVTDPGFPRLPALLQAADGVAVLLAGSPPLRPPRLLHGAGCRQIEERLLGRTFRLGLRSFFQIHVAAFQQVLECMRSLLAGEKHVVDLYAGVGAIGLSLDAPRLTLVECDREAAQLCEVNRKLTGRTDAEVVASEAEAALHHLHPGAAVVLDPPRGGLHRRVVCGILDRRPRRLLYLSCNPSTQARDVARLLSGYRLESVYGFNFFPRTPHIETLVEMTRQDLPATPVSGSLGPR
ncbi:MAG: RsmD family RNA methyltransferase [Myxococcales bacterium]|nr:RsmD family RNA methyltransferase [Myxococcota bacterium]MDW8280469.1 RsmD family RNA methyltransferase [Myxococcales bacterium]